MREFNTSGPCNTALHYTVLRETLRGEGKVKVQKGRFFTIFAPRQTGKTTYFQLLLGDLKQEGLIPIWISFESLKTLSKADFYEALSHDLQRELSKQEVKINYVIKGPLQLRGFFEKMTEQPKSIVLVIDEFEGIPEEVLSEVMHTFREIYQQRENYVLHSLILVGVRTVAELVISAASPFNIADELQIPYFTFAEVTDLIHQHIKETGQPVAPEVIKAIYDNTQGQPGLVCALCLHLVTTVVPDMQQPVTMAAFYQTLQFFLTKHLSKNIINVVQKAREKRAFMFKLLFQAEPIPFSLYDPDIAWLSAHGVVDEVEGATEVVVPLYKKVLITAFRPLFNGEVQHYLTSAHDTFSQYLTATGGLNLNALLEAYRAYVRRRGFRAFDTENLREAAWHYSLDGFISFFIHQLGGQTFVEVPSGRGRIDLLIRYGEQLYLVETKKFSTLTAFQAGKGQLVAYLHSEGLTEGYYVVFSNLHTETDELYTEEVIEGKQIYTHIVLTHFTPPSRLPVPETLKQRKKKGVKRGK